MTLEATAAAEDWQIRSAGIYEVPLEWLLEHLEFGDEFCYDSVDQMWSLKAAECSAEYLDSISQCGIVAPVNVEFNNEWIDPAGDSKAVLLDGHHRFIAAVILNLTTIPVTDYEATGIECFNDDYPNTEVPE